MAGRFDTGERIVDVAPKPLNEVPNKKRKIGLFRRLVLALVLWFLAMCALYSLLALGHPVHPESTFGWELGYRLGSLSWGPLAASFVAAWLLVPLVFSPSK